MLFFFFFFNDAATTEIYTLSLHDALPILNADNITEIAKAGADTFVAGSAVFGAANDNDPNRYETIIQSLRASLAKA